MWHPLVNDPQTPEFRGKNRRAYWVNREFMDTERDEDYSTPQCFIQAMEFLDNNHSADNWHLHLECFDPHEPFACPKKYRDMYDDTYDGSWPDTANATVEVSSYGNVVATFGPEHLASTNWNWDVFTIDWPSGNVTQLGNVYSVPQSAVKGCLNFPFP